MEPATVIVHYAVFRNEEQSGTQRLVMRTGRLAGSMKCTENRREVVGLCVVELRLVRYRVHLQQG